MADAACVAWCSYEHPEDANAEEAEISVSSLHGSISFGRYMSESLEWGKWSSFHQNRHVEEAEKYSKPGSVAQKKAYFEEQHKKKLADQKAKALLEQANTVTSSGDPVEEAADGGNHPLAQTPVGAMATAGVLEADANACTPKDCFSNEHDSEKHEIELQSLVMEDQRTMVLPSRILSSSPPNNPPLEKETHRLRKSEEDNIEVDNQTPRESPSRIISAETIEDVENQNAIAEAEASRNSQPVKPPLQESSAANREISASKEKKQKFFASKLSIFGRTSMACPPPPASLSHLKRENVSKLNKSSSHDMNESKASAPKSLHMSINLSSQKGNENTLSVAINTQIDEKIVDSRPVIPETSSRAPHRKSPMKTSTKVSAAGVHKVVMLTPQSENQSTKTQSPKTGPKTKKTNPMCQSVSTDCWKSSSSCWKRPSQVVCSPFRFRCEERAEKRKEFFLKLEEKLNAEKLQRQAKDKEMAENELKRLRQSLGFKSRPMPNFHRKTEPQRTEPKKIPTAQGQASRFGRKVIPLEVPSANCLPSSVRSSARKTGTPLKRAAGS